MTHAAPPLTSPVVSTQWLADHHGSDNLVVLDASVLPYSLPGGRSGYLSGHEEYLVSGHIPGAYFADLMEEFSDPRGAYPFTRPGADAFAAAAASVGVSNDTRVVVYDAAVGQWASRLWWLFRAFGYDNVAILNGGFTKWTLEQRPTDIGHEQPPVGRFTAHERPELWVGKDEVERIVAGETDAALVCAVPPKEFSGLEGHRSRLGHIPGSLSVPASRLVDRQSRALLPVDELRAHFAAVLDQPRVVNYCAGGIASASDALVLTLLGHTNVAIYDGSLNEWVADENAPVVTGA